MLTHMEAVPMRCLGQLAHSALAFSLKGPQRVAAILEHICVGKQRGYHIMWILN